MVGSFLNVVSIRLGTAESIIAGRSKCPHCKKTLGFFELIPVISYILLFGRCKNCGKKISWQYPLVEVVTAVIFLGLYLKFELSWSFLFLLLISCGLIVVAVYDLKKMIIPDEIIVFLTVVIILWLILYHLTPLQNNSQFLLAQTFLQILWGITLGAFIFAVLAAVSGEKWMGWGDAKLGALAGLFFGTPKVAVVIISAFFIGAIVSLVLIAAGKKRMKDKIPLGPFIVLGIFITIFWGQEILDWYLKTII